MEFGMKGKTALVLGAGGGLGRAICESLEHEGVSIAAADIDAEAIAQTEVVLSAIGVARLGLLWDVSDLSSVDSQISAIESQIGPVDILVNNTGGPPPTAAAGQDGRLWTTYFQMMVLSVIAITDRVLPGTRERGWGRIITSTSSSVVAPIPNLGISNALRL
jgi:3-oxoacyl-[acyl-carrier protein] reductase